jgi:hypothetical protein
MRQSSSFRNKLALSTRRFRRDASSLEYWSNTIKWNHPHACRRRLSSEWWKRCEAFPLQSMRRQSIITWCTQAMPLVE